MKKSLLAFLISALVLASASIWFLNAEVPMSITKILEYSVIIILAGFGAYFGISHLLSKSRGEPTEDELSKKILQKASSKAYYISLYMWLVIAYFTDKSQYETHTIIGAGILGMAILFFASWVFYKLRGMRDA